MKPLTESKLAFVFFVALLMFSGASFAKGEYVWGVADFAFAVVALVFSSLAYERHEKQLEAVEDDRPVE